MNGLLWDMPVEEGSGFVYFFRCGDFIKIGATNGPVDQRVSNFLTGNPNPCELVGKIRTSTPFALERSLHAKFWEWHHRGEWFHAPQGSEVTQGVHRLLHPERWRLIKDVWFILVMWEEGSGLPPAWMEAVDGEWQRHHPNEVPR